MKTLSPETLTVIDKPFVAPVKLLRIAFEGGLTLRLCSQVWGAPGEECLFDGEIYEPVVLSWGANNHGTIDPVSYAVDPGETEVVIDNAVPIGGAERFSELFATYSPHYATAEIVEIFVGATTAADQVFRFKGRIEDSLDMATDRVTLTFSGIELDIANRFNHTILTTDAFPSADPDDIGAMLGQGYGRLKRVPLRAIDAGNRTALVAAIGAADTSIPISDATGFPPAGTVQIELEQVSYTGITANTLTGCTRGQSGTTAASHAAGSAVSEVQSEYAYAWGHPIQVIEAVYVDRVRQSGNYTAYTGLSGDEHPSYPGRAIVAFNTMPSLNKQINIDDQISVDQGIHQHGELAYTTLFAEAIRSNSGIDYPERIPGNSVDTQAFVYDGTSGTFNFLGYKDPGGTPNRCRVGLVYRRPVGSSDARIRVRFYSGATIATDVSSTHGDYEFHNSVSAWVSCPLTWAQISAGYFIVDDYDITGNAINCCCVWLDVEHTVDSSEATGVEKQGTVVLTGNSGADVVIGSEVAADLRGWQDDISGTFTGTPFGLIEQPAAICKHILIDRCGLSVSVIGASYAAAGAFFAAQNYRLAVAVLDRPNARELLNQIAVQSCALEFWEAGTHQIVPVGGDITAVKTLTADRIDQGQTQLQFTPRIDIVNRLTGRYGREWSGHADQLESDRAIVSAESTASIAKFGTLEGDQHSFPFIIDQQQAVDVLALRLKEQAFPRIEVEFVSGYSGSDLERGDVVTFDFTPGDALDKALLRLIKPIIDHFRILDTVDNEGAIYFKAVFVVSQFDLSASMAAATDTAPAMLILDFDLAAAMASGTDTTAALLALLNEVTATVSVATQTSAIEVLNVGATWELSGAMAGATMTPAVDISVLFTLTAVMSGQTATSTFILENIYELSPVMAGATLTNIIDLFNPQDIPISATMAGVTTTSAAELLEEIAFSFDILTAAPNETFTLPLTATGTYNFEVSWGDGTSDTITVYNQAEATHTYATAGTYEIKITGTIIEWAFVNSTSAPKVRDVKSWGGLLVGSTGNQFNGCANMTVSASMGDLDISGVTNMYRMFSGCAALNSDFSGLDVSGVANLSYMFFGCTAFTSDLSAWNVANVTDLSGMFYNAAAFTSNVGGWNVTNCTNFSAMFLGTALTTPHYDSLLIGWSQLTLGLYKVFHAGTAKYSPGAATTARGVLTGTYLWSITDGGQL
jgi:surface protein